jgi:asparagine synthase (glutamine-hydrolysing)
LSLICGVFALRPDARIPDHWQQQLRASLTRSGHGSVREHLAPQLALYHLDVGAYVHAGFAGNQAGDLAIACGDPLLASRLVGGTRTSDVATLLAAEPAALERLLRDSRGNFNFIHYRAADRTLLLAIDRLGCRPLYWVRHGDFVVFSGAKRLLTRINDLGLKADPRGLIETVALGYSLADRTEYAGVASMEGGTLLLLGEQSVVTQVYWDWCKDSGPPQPETPVLRRELYEEFCRSVAVRIGNARGAFASLSSGLDSRCVATTLCSHADRLHTLNVSWEGSVDRLIGREYAHALGSVHSEDILPDVEAGRDVPRRCWAMMQSGGAQAIASAGGSPQQLWGGNDGSVSVGYLYVGSAIVAALRRKDLTAAASLFLATMGVELSGRPFRRGIRSWALSVPLEGVRDELQRLDCTEPGQRLYYYLLVNHQRRMLARHYEEIDLFPFEHVEPFFDTTFLAKACTLAVDASIGHGLYHRWLTEFPPVVSAMPWQTYPGHDACPLPLPEPATGQWEIARSRVVPSHRHKTLQRIDSLLANSEDVGALLSPWRLRLLRMANQMGMVDGLTAFNQAIRIADALSPLRASTDEVAGKS